MDGNDSDAATCDDRSIHSLQSTEWTDAESLVVQPSVLIKHTTIVTVSQPVKCSSVILAKEFLNSLNWRRTLFDDSQDRCYCHNCYLACWSDILPAGNDQYVIPRGWVRFGLRVDPIYTNEHDLWNRWIVTYHGTTIAAARSILLHRHFYLPGDKLIDGTILGIREGHIPDKNFIFTSPTIAYSSSRVYSPNNEFYSRTYNAVCEAQIVLQCRQQPKSFEIQRETIGAGMNRICQHIPNERIEYYTDIRPSIIAYGLLARTRPKMRQ